MTAPHKPWQEPRHLPEIRFDREPDRGALEAKSGLGSRSGDDRIWQVKLPDGSMYVDIDARPNNPRASWIYARSTADEIAKRIGGTVIEVTRTQQERVLDREIATAPTGPTKPRSTKARTRSFGRTAKRAIATAILESVPLNYHARAALDTARETAVCACPLSIPIRQRMVML